MVTLPCREGIILGFGRGGNWRRLFYNTHDWFPLSRNSVNPSQPGAPVEPGAVKRPPRPVSDGECSQSAWEHRHQRVFLRSSSAAWSRLGIRLGPTIVLAVPCLWWYH